MKQAWLFLKILFVRLRFIGVFVAIGLVIGNWDWLMNVVDRHTRPEASHVAEESDEEWFCPMHLTVIRATPGKCPICGMDLARRKKGVEEELPDGVLARVSLSPLRIRQAGLSSVPVEHRPLVRTIRTVGTIEYDEGRLTDLSARIAGRADELFIKYVGTRVERGSPIYKIFSPDLVSTQKEYLLAHADLKRLEADRQADATAVKRARDTVQSGRERLVLWGITPEQVAHLEERGEVQTHLVIRSPVAGVVVKKEIHAGHYVEVGEDPYLIADISSVWVMAEIFERDLGLVRVGQTVEISTEAYPGETFSGVVALLEPSLRTDTRTVRVRADVTNLDLKLRPGMAVTATLRAPLAPSGRAPWTCCIGEDGAESCTKCSMAHGASDRPAADSVEHTIWICPTHPTFAKDQPGNCDLCGKMDLLPKKVGAGQELVWTCPDHPDVAVKDPGDCPEGAHRPLEWKIVPRAPSPDGRSVWVCPMHPTFVRDEPGICEQCGKMKLVEQAIAPDQELVWTCPDHPEVVAKEPGDCPEGAHRKLVWKIVPKGAAPAAKRTIWVCPMHKTFARDEPGKCELCGGMVLEEQEIAADQELVWACADHPEVAESRPGDCPKGAHRKLEWKVVPRAAAVDGHACPHPPEPSESGKLTCPECGHEMKEGAAQPVLAVPVSAVIDTGERKVVYVERAGGVYDAVEIVVGPRADLWYPVLSGLALGDRVVERGAFLLDAEAHLNPAAGSAFFGASGGSGK